MELQPIHQPPNDIGSSLPHVFGASLPNAVLREAVRGAGRRALTDINKSAGRPPFTGLDLSRRRCTVHLAWVRSLVVYLR